MRTATRLLASLTLTLGSLGTAAVAMAPRAAAEPTMALDWTVSAHTHLAKAGFDVSVPPGSFVGNVDLGTGVLTGDMSLPPAAITLKLLGMLPALDATFEIAGAGPVTGKADFTTLHVDTTATFNIRLAKLAPAGTSVNLVGDRCTTAKPITVSMGGKADLAAGSTFSGTYTIPPFTRCGALTPLLNLLIPGPGNTFTATFVPKGSPLPSPPAEPSPPVAPAGVTSHASVHVGVQVGDQQSEGSTGMQIELLPPLGQPLTPSNDSGLLGLLLRP